MYVVVVLSSGYLNWIPPLIIGSASGFLQFFIHVMYFFKSFFFTLSHVSYIQLKRNTQGIVQLELPHFLSINYYYYFLNYF